MCSLAAGGVQCLRFSCPILATALFISRGRAVLAQRYIQTTVSGAVYAEKVIRSAGSYLLIVFDKRLEVKSGIVIDIQRPGLFNEIPAFVR